MATDPAGLCSALAFVSAAIASAALLARARRAPARPEEVASSPAALHDDQSSSLSRQQMRAVATVFPLVIDTSHRSPAAVRRLELDALPTPVSETPSVAQNEDEDSVDWSALAESSSAGPRRPIVVGVAGGSGSGKTSIASLIAKQLSRNARTRDICIHAGV